MFSFIKQNSDPLKVTMVITLNFLVNTTFIFYILLTLYPAEIIIKLPGYNLFGTLVYRFLERLVLSYIFCLHFINHLGFEVIFLSVVSTTFIYRLGPK